MTLGPSLARALRPPPPSHAAPSPSVAAAVKDDVVRGVEDVVAIVARYYKLSIEDIYSTDRHKSVAEARHVAIYLCRRLPGAARPSFPEIGRVFCRDHSTIMSAFNKIKTQRTIHRELNKQLEEIEKLLDPSTPRPPPERFVWSEDEGGALVAVIVKAS